LKHFRKRWMLSWPTTKKILPKILAGKTSQELLKSIEPTLFTIMAMLIPRPIRW